MSVKWGITFDIIAVSLDCCIMELRNSVKTEYCLYRHNGGTKYHCCKNRSTILEITSCALLCTEIKAQLQENECFQFQQKSRSAINTYTK